MKGNEKLYVSSGGAGNATLTVKELTAYIVAQVQSGGAITVTSSQISDSTATGRNVLTAASGSDAQTAIGISTYIKSLMVQSDSNGALTSIGVVAAWRVIINNNSPSAAQQDAARALLNGAKAGANTDITSITGSAATLTTARTFTFTNAVSGSGSFNGSANVSIALTLAAPTSSVRGGTLLQTAIADLTAAPTQADFNGLLAKLRSAGILTP